MAQIPLTFPDGERNRIINGVCGFHSYQEQIQEDYTIPSPAPGQPPMPAVRMIPNPETKAQFAQRMIAQTVKEWVASFEESQDHAAVPRRQRPAIT